MRQQGGRVIRPVPSRLEAYVLGALLVVSSVAPLALRSGAWVELFARGPVLADLGSQLTGPVTREAGELVVAGGRREVAAVRIPFAGRSGGRYLLRLATAADGPPMVVTLIDPDWTLIDGPYRRVAGGVARITLSPAEASAGTELRIAFRPPGVLRITDLELREVAPAYRWLPPLLGGLGPLVALVFCWRHRRWILGRAAPASPAAGLADRWLLALALLLVSFLAFYRAPVAQVFDSRYLSVVSHSLLTQGTTAIPDGLLAVNPATTYHLEYVGGRTVHFFSHAPAILNAPVVWALGRFGVRPVDAAGTMLAEAETEILRVSAALIAAGLCLLLYGIGRRWLAAGPSLALVAVFAFGTQIFSTISRPYWSHAWASLLLAGALYLLVAAGTRERPAAYVAIGSLLSWAFFCRPILALSVIAITLLVAFRRRAFLPHLVATGLVWLALLVVYSQQVFGTLLPRYFLTSHLYSGRLALPGGGHDYLSAAAGTLVSPGRGLFLFVPLYLVVLWVVVHRWRRLADRPLAIAALAVIAVHWQVVSSFRNWWGGAAYGPRLFSDVVVWFFVLAVLGLAAGSERSGEPRAVAGRRLGRLAIAAAVTWSLFVNYRGATARETIAWPAVPIVATSHDERQEKFQRKLWDWRDPQFLAGLLDRPVASD